MAKLGPNWLREEVDKVSKRGVKRICKCECGGTVRGVFDFGRWFTWCEKCSPVVRVVAPNYKD